ncbi:MAG: hypothetical protein WEC82_05730 [Xanthobacteraceae bacterium]
MRRFFHPCGLFYGLCAAVVFAAGPSLARSGFDGAWSVTILTEKGTCDPAYRYAVLIADGEVTIDPQQSSGVVDISGKVDPRGQVKVSLRRGEQRADGVGKLSGATGTGIGTWSGKSATEACSGRWEAARD